MAPSTRLRHASFAAAALAVLLAAAPLAGQESTTRGLNLGLHVSGASLQPENGDRSNAGGGGLFVGYGFNRSFQLFLQLDGAQFEVDETEVDGDWRMGHGDLGLRYHFANSLRSWVPYLEAAFSFRVANVEDAEVDQQSITDHVGIFGGALTLGGGLMVFFNETLALDLQLALSGGDFTNAKIGDATIELAEPYRATTTRLNIGLSWWP